MLKNTRAILALLLCSVVLFSCNPDDNGNPLDELIGTWDITALSITDCNDPNDNSVDGQDIIGCMTEDGFEVCGAISFTFDVNGNVTSTFTSTITLLATGQTQTDSEDEISTFTINGNEITICSDGDCETATFSVAGTTLTISESGTNDGCTSSLSGTKRP